MSVTKVKAAVRCRDGYRCTRCGMTHEEHVARYGKTLDVHRVVPGSVYTEPACVTLCRKCHGPQPRCPRGCGWPPKLIIDTEEDVRLAVKLAANKADVGLSELVNEILRKALAAEIEDAKKYVPRRRKPKGERCDS